MRTRTDSLVLALVAFILGLELALLARTILQLDQLTHPAQLRWFVFGPNGPTDVPAQPTDPGEAALEARRRAWFEEHPDQPLPAELRVEE